VRIDRDEAEGRYAREPAHELTPKRIFDRTWALILLGRVLERLREEYHAADQSAAFEALCPVLTDGPRAVPYATLAARLGTTEGAVRVSVHRLRRRYGERLREEIAATIDDPSEVDDEIRALFTALGT
jgi:RNA polymerase sigma-70 factor (ECF subfamily)